MTRLPTKLKRSRPTFHQRKTNTARFNRYTSATLRESYLGSTRGNETPLSRLDIFQRRVLKVLTINQAHIHTINDQSGGQQNPRFKFRRIDAVSFYQRRKTDNRETDFRCSSISHQPFYLLRLLERYTLSTTRFPSQSFDETGCDYFLFPTPGKKDYISIDQEILSPYFTPSQVTKQYGAYTASIA